MYLIFVISTNRGIKVKLLDINQTATDGKKRSNRQQNRSDMVHRQVSRPKLCKTDSSRCVRSERPLTKGARFGSSGSMTPICLASSFMISVNSSRLAGAVLLSDMAHSPVV